MPLRPDDCQIALALGHLDLDTPSQESPNDGVQEIHDLHVWPMSTTETALTVHLSVPTGYPGDDFTSRVCHALQERFGIGHATIQIETDAATPCELESDKTV